MDETYSGSRTRRRHGRNRSRRELVFLKPQNASTVSPTMIALKVELARAQKTAKANGEVLEEKIRAMKVLRESAQASRALPSAPGVFPATVFPRLFVNFATRCG